MPPQPGDEVLRSHKRRRTAGTALVRTITWDPPPLPQSAELQMRRPPAAMTTDTNFVPILKRHGHLCWETACTVKRGVAPTWYQYCGDDRPSVTCPGAQTTARPAEWDRVVLRCGEGSEAGRGEGFDGARSLLTCAGAGPAALVPPRWAACSAAGRAASIPVAAQLTVVSKPIPTARTNTRRRQ